MNEFHSPLKDFSYFRFMILVNLLFFVSLLNAQVDTKAELYPTLRAKDSLLFQVGFNTCNIEQFEALVSENFEFYHDQSGITSTKSAFISSTKEGLCRLAYKATRVLEEGSLKVFPLKNNGTLYGAIQTGEHRFYAKYPDREKVLTSTAKFSHVWLLENGEWKLSRVLSYDHKSPDEKSN